MYKRILSLLLLVIILSSVNTVQCKDDEVTPGIFVNGRRIFSFHHAKDQDLYGSCGLGAISIVMETTIMGSFHCETQNRDKDIHSIGRKATYLEKDNVVDQNEFYDVNFPLKVNVNGINGSNPDLSEVFQKTDKNGNYLKGLNFTLKYAYKNVTEKNVRHWTTYYVKSTVKPIYGSFAEHIEEFAVNVEVESINDIGPDPGPDRPYLRYILFAILVILFVWYLTHH